MTREEIKRRTEVQQAFLNGKAIQARLVMCKEWKPASDPTFNWFEYDYRVRPEEVIIRPWINIPDNWSFYKTKEEADQWWERFRATWGKPGVNPRHRSERIACKQIEIRYFVGEGLS